MVELEENPFEKLKRLGPYHIEEQLGHGGMGYVFKANDTRSGKTVAIKVIAGDFSMDESMVTRFKREAAFLKGLNHPNIVQVFDVNMEGEFKYYVMEFIPGRTISDEVKGVPLSVDDVLGIAWQVADALGAAHSAGIIHRDIKAANIMRDEGGAIKLTDFGIARVVGVSGGTTAGKFLGTPAYMSPEQILGKELGTASDMYSFGVVLYEMLTGRVPFESDNPLDVMRKHVYEEPVFPKELNSEVPAVLSELVMRMLKKRREDRISNLGIFESQLQDCVRVMHGDLVTVTAKTEIEERTAREQKLRFVKIGMLVSVIIVIMFFIVKSGGGLDAVIKRYLMPPPLTDEQKEELREKVRSLRK